jgi:hypothetical protein
VALVCTDVGAAELILLVPEYVARCELDRPDVRVLECCVNADFTVGPLDAAAVDE